MEYENSKPAGTKGYYRKRDFGAAIHSTKSVGKVTKGFALAEKACFPQLS